MDTVLRLLPHRFAAVILFNGWDSDFSYVTKSMTVTAQYHEDSQAILKSEAEASLTAIASSITNANLKAQAALVAEARQAVAT